MVFLRVKRIRGRDYAYLVESRWDAARHTSHQATLRYVGPADSIRLEDVPAEYRDARVKAFILQHSVRAEDRRRQTVSRLQEQFLEALTAGDRKKAGKVAEETTGVFGLDAFYVEVLTPCMHRVGDLWKTGNLTVSMEHLASNILRDLLDASNARIRVSRRARGTAVLCTPQGEMHSLGAKVLEGLLLQRGYRSWNIAASAPTESIADFIMQKKPDLVLVSLTIPQYIPSLRRLLAELRARKMRAKVLVGGQGIRGLPPQDLPPPAALVPDGTLEALDRACGVERSGG